MECNIRAGIEQCEQNNCNGSNSDDLWIVITPDTARGKSAGNAPQWQRWRPDATRFAALYLHRREVDATSATLSQNGSRACSRAQTVALREAAKAAAFDMQQRCGAAHLAPGFA